MIHHVTPPLPTTQSVHAVAILIYVLTTLSVSCSTIHQPSLEAVAPIKRGKALSVRSTAQMVIVTSLAQLRVWLRSATLYLSYLQADICAAVQTHWGVVVYPAATQHGDLFCCSNFDLVNNTCVISTHGSSSPFYIEPALVINNRTSGATSPNSTETTVIVTSTVTALSEIATSSTTLNDVPITNTATVMDTATATAATACSKSSHIAIASSVSALLGLALLVTLGFFWRLRKQRQKLSRAVQEWKLKYSELMEARTATTGGAEHQTPQQLHGWHPDELDGQPHFPAQLES